MEKSKRQYKPGDVLPQPDPIKAEQGTVRDPNTGNLVNSPAEFEDPDKKNKKNNQETEKHP